MRRDEAYLLDILIAAREASAFVADLSWREFAESRLHQNAVVKALEVIGEAAGRISVETRQAHPEIPWAEIIGMRNRLVHGYFEIDVAQVWDTVHHDVPPLMAAVEPLVPPE